MMSMIKTSAILISVALATAPAMALAQSDTCFAGIGSGFCHTDNIPANSQFNFVHIDVSGPCDFFKVVDRENSIIVYQGASGWNGKQKTIGGLYSEYSVYLYGGAWPVTNVTINN